MECKNALKRCLYESIMFNKVCDFSNNCAVLTNKRADLRDNRVSCCFK
jgi:hypothetical protein